MHRNERGLAGILRRAAVLALVGGLGCGAPGAPTADIQTVVLVTLDTTRADHIGCYGYTRNTTPRLDRFAAEALRYENAVATGTWTLPSHASLFTGKFTASHGARNDPEGSLALSDAIPTNASSRQMRLRTIATDEVTLAALLQEHGFRTAAVVGGPYLKRGFGLDRGFDHYDDANIGTLNGRSAEDVTYRALVWLERTAGQRRFLFLNYFDPHVPLWPPDGFARAFLPSGLPPTDAMPTLDQSLRLYDAEILYMDHHLGRLFDGLAELGLYDDALIVVTGDHGEAFGERGEFAHAGRPFQNQIHIPLIVRQPGGQPAATSAAWTSLTDVAPLILDRLGLPVPTAMQGGVPPEVGHPIVAESHTFGGGTFRALIDPDGTKLVASDRGPAWLFDLASDPREEHDLAETRGERVREMRGRLDAFLDGLPPPGPQPAPARIDRETEAMLRNLGYLD